MYDYHAYGLTIHSDLVIPEFRDGNGGEDVVIHLGATGYIPPEARGQEVYLVVTPGEAILVDASIGAFTIKGGHEINVFPTPGADLQKVRYYLIGNVMAILLFQRGNLVLHASSSALDGQAIAFLGSSGSGKSSVAAAMHSRGHTLIADDVSSIDVQGGIPWIAPGFPRFKLSTRTALSLVMDFSKLIQLEDTGEKEYTYPLPLESFASKPLPLSRVYVLGESSSISIEPLSPQEAVIELIRNSIPTRFGHPGNAQHFSQCVSLSREISFFRLNRPSSIEQLPELARAVEGHRALTR